MNILLVDDDPSIPDLLSRLLKPAIPNGAVTIAHSAKEGLSLMNNASFDVVVSDLNMPEMTGDRFLAEVQKRHPDTVRLLFTSEPGSELTHKLTGTAHQVLKKPDSLASIKTAITRTIALREMVSVSDLVKVVSQIENLPSLPDLYYTVVNELESPDPSIQRIGEAMEKDMAMSVKILKLVNSAFFGLREHVSSPAQAASLLGLDVLKSMVLMLHIFSEDQQLKIQGFSLNALCTHGLTVAAGAREIATLENKDRNCIDDAFIAGLFHDVGKLVIAANLPIQYDTVYKRIRARKITLIDAEHDVLGSTHAEIGAYLLALWGFRDSVIEACAFHHTPSRSRDDRFTALSAVHAANAFDYEAQVSPYGELGITLDEEYYKRLKLDARIDLWKQTCMNVGPQDKPASP